MTPPPKKDPGVLVVSNGEFAHKMCDALSSTGCNATIVSDPAQAQKAIFDGVHRVMVLDACMEGFDAYKALNDKHGEKLLSRVPLFLISDSRVPIDISKIPQNCKVDFINPMYMGVNDAAELVKRSANKNR